MLQRIKCWFGFHIDSRAILEGAPMYKYYKKCPACRREYFPRSQGKLGFGG